MSKNKQEIIILSDSESPQKMDEENVVNQQQDQLPKNYYQINQFSNQLQQNSQKSGMINDNYYFNSSQSQQNNQNKLQNINSNHDDIQQQNQNQQTNTQNFHQAMTTPGGTSSVQNNQIQDQNIEIEYQPENQNQIQKQNQNQNQQIDGLKLIQVDEQTPLPRSQNNAQISKKQDYNLSESNQIVSENEDTEKKQGNLIKHEDEREILSNQNIQSEKFNQQNSDFQILNDLKKQQNQIQQNFKTKIENLKQLSAEANKTIYEQNKRVKKESDDQYIQYQEKILELKTQMAQERELFAREKGEFMAQFEGLKSNQNSLVQSLEEQIKMENDKVQELRNLLNNIQNKSSQQEFEITQLKRTNIELDRHIKKQQEILETSLSFSEKKIDSGMANSNTLLQQLDQIKFQLEQTEKLLEKNKDKLKEANDDLTEAYIKIDEQKNENLILTAQVNQMEQQLVEYKAQEKIDKKFLSKYDQKNNEFMQKLNLYQETLEEFKKKYQKDQDLFKQKDEQIENFVQENKRLIEEKQNLYKENNSQQQEIDKLKRKIETLENSQIKKLEQEQLFDMEQSRFAEISNQLSKIMQTMEGQDQQMQVLDEEKLEALKQKDYWYEKSLEYEKQIENLEQKIEDFESQIESLQNEIEEGFSRPKTRINKNNQKNQRKNTKRASNNAQVKSSMNIEDQKTNNDINTINNKENNDLNIKQQNTFNNINSQKNQEDQENQAPNNNEFKKNINGKQETDNQKESNRIISDTALQNQNQNVKQQQKLQQVENNSMKQNLLNKQNKMGIFGKPTCCPNCKLLIQKKKIKQCLQCASCQDLIHINCLESDQRNAEKIDKLCSLCFDRIEKSQQLSQQNKMQEE